MLKTEIENKDQEVEITSIETGDQHPRQRNVIKEGISKEITDNTIIMKGITPNLIHTAITAKTVKIRMTITIKSLKSSVKKMIR